MSGTTGSINGRVTDNINAVLPGVAVTISSPSLMGTPTAIWHRVRADDEAYRAERHLIDPA